MADPEGPYVDYAGTIVHMATRAHFSDDEEAQYQIILTSPVATNPANPAMNRDGAEASIRGNNCEFGSFV